MEANKEEIMCNRSNYKGKVYKKLLIAIVIIIGLSGVPAWTIWQKRRELLKIYKRLEQLNLRANYGEEYIEKNRGKVLVEIPEVYELANIAMVNFRKFVRFREFTEELLKPYRNREQAQTIPDLYPAILDWAEKYK